LTYNLKQTVSAVSDGKVCLYVLTAGCPDSQNMNLAKA